MLDGIQAGGKQELLMRHELTCCICIAYAACIYTHRRSGAMTHKMECGYWRSHNV